MAVSRIFLSTAFYGFSGFLKEVTNGSCAKTFIQRDLLCSLLPRLSFRGMHDKPSLFNNPSRNNCQADCEKLKMKAKDDFLNISRLG